MDRLRAALLPILCGVVGILMAHNPMIRTGLERVQVDPGDSRLHNYTLEHEFLWATGDPAHASFWSPPVFYPVENTAAYTDLLAGVAPPYFLFRLCGAAHDTAFQLWMFALSALNYAGAWLLLRRGCRLPGGAAAIGAFVVAFASPRVAQLAQQQLYPSFFATTAVLAAIRIFEPDPLRRRAGPWWALLAGCVVAQLYSGFYTGWFLIFGGGVAALWALALARTRPPLLAALRRDWPWILGSGAVAAAALFPLARHYLAAAREAGYRVWELDVVQFLPTWRSWIYLGRTSWAYGWLSRFPELRPRPFEQEHELGLGIATTLVVALGLWRERRRPIAGLALLVMATFFVLSLNTGGGASAWRLVFDFVPGAKAIRAVSRIAIVLLVPAGIGAALFFESARRDGLGRVTLALLAVVCILEQGQTTATYSKEGCRERAAAIAEKIAPGSDAFFMTPVNAQDPWYVYHLDAMEAQLLARTPCVNGYSGLWPRWWPFLDLQVNSPQDVEQRTAGLADWIRGHELASKKICWVTIQEKH